MSKKAKLRLLVYSITSICLAIIVLLFILIVNMILVFSTPDELKGDFLVTYDDTDEMTKPYLVYNVGVDKLYRNGKWYVDFSEIADIYGFSVSGDYSDLRYIFRNENDDIMNVKFSENALVLNGNLIYCDLFELGADGAVYLPVDVINTFFDGIMISYDTEEKSLLVQCEELCYLKVRQPQTTPKIDKVQIP